ncbi:alpha-ketoglutarate dependent xanthine dioxygenase [Leptodontidium sp. MPI-SDFR-AT-0119]|nr:alpha-ketoglutarate dependent xanthine dioxygenase [Leptodontidium sp. MPI-SDFR-AT-0119]
MPRRTRLWQGIVFPLSADQTKNSLIGAEVVLCSGLPRMISPLDLTHEDISTLRQALYDYSVLVIRKQNGIEPSVLPQLARIWDEDIVYMHSGGAKANHTEFHGVPLSQEETESGQTRFHRRHMVMPCYEALPGRVTLVHGVKIPKAPDQKVVFENGTVLRIAAGATAFVSGALAFSLLSTEEQSFALNTTIQYAPRRCEIPLDELPLWKNDHVQSHTMVWRNPGRPAQPHLQILGACIHSLKTADPYRGEITTVDDVAEARRIFHTFMKKAMSAEFIYAHTWEEGDLVIFYNQGVLHSITGQLKDEKRLMWQCNMASSMPPERFTGE